MAICEGYGSSMPSEKSSTFDDTPRKGQMPRTRQHDVADEDGADDDCKIGKLHNYFLANLLNNTIR